MNIFQHTPEVDQAVREWATRYAQEWTAAAEHMRPTPEFQAYAREVAERGWTEDYALTHFLDDSWNSTAWPEALAPWWATIVDVGMVSGGEVWVSFHREFTNSDGVEVATLRHAINVVVDTDPKYNASHPGATLGDWEPADNGGVTFAVAHGKQEDLSRADVVALGEALGEARSILEQIEAADAELAVSH